MVADDARVAAGGDDCVLDPARLQNPDSMVDRVTLADATQVDAHPFVLETDAVMQRIEQQILVIDGRQGGLDLRLRRLDVFREVVQVPDAGIRDVERALGDLREIKRAFDQVEQLRIDLDRLLRRACVDLR